MILGGGVRPGRNSGNNSVLFTRTENLSPLNNLVCISKNCTVNSQNFEAEGRGPGDLRVRGVG